MLDLTLFWFLFWFSASGVDLLFVIAPAYLVVIIGRRVLGRKQL